MFNLCQKTQNICLMKAVTWFFISLMCITWLELNIYYTIYLHFYFYWNKAHFTFYTYTLSACVYIFWDIFFYLCLSIFFCTAYICKTWNRSNCSINNFPLEISKTFLILNFPNNSVQDFLSKIKKISHTQKELVKCWLIYIYIIILLLNNNKMSLLHPQSSHSFIKPELRVTVSCC